MRRRTRRVASKACGAKEAMPGKRASIQNASPEGTTTQRRCPTVVTPPLCGGRALNMTIPPGRGGRAKHDNLIRAGRRSRRNDGDKPAVPGSQSLQLIELRGTSPCRRRDQPVFSPVVLEWSGDRSGLQLSSRWSRLTRAEHSPMGMMANTQPEGAGINEGGAGGPELRTQANARFSKVVSVMKVDGR